MKVKLTHIWPDGICKKCGGEVYEMACDYIPEIPETEYADYKNICSNEDCVEHKFHYVGDIEQADYYEHYRK